MIHKNIYEYLINNNNEINKQEKSKQEKSKQEKSKQEKSKQEKSKKNKPKENMITVYTDGSTLNNKRLSKKAKGGIGVFFGIDDPRNVSESFYNMPITNQRTELAAIGRAIKEFSDWLIEKKSSRISKTDETDKYYKKPTLEICSDSQYAIKSLSEWIINWKKRGWKKADGKEILNLDLIYSIDKLIEESKKNFNIKFRHVRAHKSPPSDKSSQEYKDWFGNMMADKYATQASHKSL